VGSSEGGRNRIELLVAEGTILCFSAVERFAE